MKENQLVSEERKFIRPSRISRDPLQNESFAVRLMVILKILGVLTIIVYGAIFMFGRLEHMDDTTRHGYERIGEIVRADPRMSQMVERAIVDGRISSYEFQRIKEKNRELGND